MPIAITEMCSQSYRLQVVKDNGGGQKEEKVINRKKDIQRAEDKQLLEGQGKLRRIRELRSCESIRLVIVVAAAVAAAAVVVIVVMVLIRKGQGFSKEI